MVNSKDKRSGKRQSKHLYNRNALPPHLATRLQNTVGNDTVGIYQNLNLWNTSKIFRSEQADIPSGKDGTFLR